MDADARDNHFLVQIRFIHTVIGVVKGNMVIRGDLYSAPFHVFVRYRRQRHKLPAFLITIIPAAGGLFRKGSVVELVQFFPEVTVELVEAEVIHLLQVMEDTLLQNAHGIFNGTLVLGPFDLGWEDDSVVMFCPFCIILVQLRVDPVPVGNDSLLAVVTDHQSRNPPK